MKKRYIKRSLIAFGLLLLVSLLLAGPVLAAEFETGDVITIDEDVDDDLYVAGSEITVNATIHGDLIAVGGEITINGTVEGDFWAAAGRIRIYGTVTDDVRMAGSDLILSSTGQVGDDLFGAGFGFAWIHCPNFLGNAGLIESGHHPVGSPGLLGTWLENQPNLQGNCGQPKRVNARTVGRKHSA